MNPLTPEIEPAPFAELAARRALPIVPQATAWQRFSLWPTIEPPLRVPLVQLGPHDCPYLPGRIARDRAFLAESLSAEAYEALMDSGFRRSGRVVYQPACSACRACRPVRTPVDRFNPMASKRFRRCFNRNDDLDVRVGPLEATPEKFELYRRYQAQRHGERDHLDWPSFVDFLYDTPVETLEFSYRERSTGSLLAIGICDVGPKALSSVYFYYAPDQPRRSVGIFGALAEIEHCRRTRVPYYYLGFHVDGCGAMAYKTDFGPYELLGTDGVWRRGDQGSPDSFERG